MKKPVAAKTQSRNAASGKKAPTIIGRQRFAKISAVEGIVLSKDMAARTAEFDESGRSAAERRTLIIRTYRRG
jgi:hypothetical protein